MGIFPRAPTTKAGNIAVISWEYSQPKEFLLPQAKEFQIFPGYSLIIANFFSSNKRVPFTKILSRQYSQYSVAIFPTTNTRAIFPTFSCHFDLQQYFRPTDGQAEFHHCHLAQSELLSPRGPPGREKSRRGPLRGRCDPNITPPPSRPSRVRAGSARDVAILLLAYDSRTVPHSGRRPRVSGVVRGLTRGAATIAARAAPPQPPRARGAASDVAGRAST